MNLLVFILVVMISYTTGYGEQCKPSTFPREPQSGCCGTTEPEKVNLTKPYRTLGQYPWIGLVEYEKENETELVYGCNAFLISSRYALSAAECFTKNATDVGTPVNVLLGEFDRSNDYKDCIIAFGGKLNCSDDPISIPIEKTIVHPDFNNNGNKQNDIALIRLAEMAPFTDFISPICLPVSDVTVNPPESLHLISVGWRNINLTGLLETSEHSLLLIFEALSVHSNTCKSSYDPNTIIGNGQICAKSENMTADIIDTGLPLINTNGEFSEVVGITSYPGEAGLPDVYTKVFAYKAWIQANMKEESSSHAINSDNK